jgi:hypothetical protein
MSRRCALGEQGYHVVGVYASHGKLKLGQCRLMTCSMPFTPLVAQHMPPSVALKALDILPVCLSWKSLLLHLPPPPKWMTARNGSANHKSRPWTGPGQPPPRAIKLPRNRWPIKPGPGDGERWGPAPSNTALDSTRTEEKKVDSGCVRVMSKLRSNHVSEVRGSGGVSVSTTVL